jgi:hypothetical protein
LDSAAAGLIEYVAAQNEGCEACRLAGYDFLAHAAVFASSLCNGVAHGRAAGASEPGAGRAASAVWVAAVPTGSVISSRTAVPAHTSVTSDVTDRRTCAAGIGAVEKSVRVVVGIVFTVSGLGAFDAKPAALARVLAAASGRHEREGSDSEHS